MGEFRFEAITLLVILLPGFLAARIEQRLVVNPEQNEFDKTIEALLYSFFIYLTFTAIYRSFPVSLTIGKTGESSTYSINASPFKLALLPLIAILLAALTALASNQDFFGSFFRWLGVTRRTWRASIWSDVFHNYGGVVQVELADGRSVIGWLKYYSDRAENASLFLERASWVAAGTTEPVTIDGPGIFLTSESGIRSILFLRHETTEQPEEPPPTSGR
jgi:hypothetical protein